LYKPQYKKIYKYIAGCTTHNTNFFKCIAGCTNRNTFAKKIIAGCTIRNDNIF